MKEGDGLVEWTDFDEEMGWKSERNVSGKYERTAVNMWYVRLLVM